MRSCISAMKKLLPLPQSPNNATASGSGVSRAASTDTIISTSAAAFSRSAARTRPLPGSGTVSAVAPGEQRATRLRGR
jgi:hypothetical protein